MPDDFNFFNENTADFFSLNLKVKIEGIQRQIFNDNRVWTMCQSIVHSSFLAMVINLNILTCTIKKQLILTYFIFGYLRLFKYHLVQTLAQRFWLVKMNFTLTQKCVKSINRSAFWQMIL